MYGTIPSNAFQFKANRSVETYISEFPRKFSRENFLDDAIVSLITNGFCESDNGPHGLHSVPYFSVSVCNYGPQQIRSFSSNHVPVYRDLEWALSFGMGTLTYYITFNESGIVDMHLDEYDTVFGTMKMNPFWSYGDFTKSVNERLLGAVSNNYHKN